MAGCARRTKEADGSRSCHASTQLDGGVTGDAELITSARSGDTAAIGALYERHAAAAWVVARQYTDSPADADDVVADSFTAVFGALERGNGPEAAFRAYLFTVVRRVAGVRREKNRRVQPTDDIAVLEAGTALAGTAEDPALAGFERGVVARAFHSLPERWQAVLWHTEVEGLTPAEIAPILGLTANGTAALAYRAREGLRQAYLQQHLQDPLDEGVPRRRRQARRLRPRRARVRARPRRSRRTSRTAATCRGLLLELGDVNHGMRAVIAPLVLGLLGLGALGVALPVGGGLAAGAAAAAAAGAGAEPVPAASRPVARQRPEARRRVPRRRPARSVRSAPARPGVRPRPVAWRRSWRRSRSVPPRWSWAASRSLRSPLWPSPTCSPLRTTRPPQPPNRPPASPRAALRRRRPPPARPRRRSRPTSRHPSRPTCPLTTSC